MSTWVETVSKAILIDKRPVPETDCVKWANWFQRANRQVAWDVEDGVRVSTVFLGIDHGFGGGSLWFETMIFGGKHDGYQDRYETWEQAELGHRKALALVGELH